MVEEAPGDFREPEGSHSSQKLAALKQAIADAGLPVFIYDAQWDTAQKRLTKLEAFGDKVHTDLLQSLKDDPELAPRFTPKASRRPMNSPRKPSRWTPSSRNAPNASSSAAASP